MHQMAGTRHLLYGLGEGLDMAFRLAGRLVEKEPLICGIPVSPQGLGLAISVLFYSRF
jgi:hypothetical protein